MKLDTRLARAGIKRARLAADLGTATADLAEFVRQAFAEGYTGPDIARLSGLSIPRVYQIRDGRR